MRLRSDTCAGRRFVSILQVRRCKRYAGIILHLPRLPVNLASNLRRYMLNNKPGYKPQNGVVGPVRNHGGARNMWISPPSIRNGTYPSGLFGVSVPGINIQPPSGGRSGNDKPVSLPVFFCEVNNGKISGRKTTTQELDAVCLSPCLAWSGG